MRSTKATLSLLILSVALATPASAQSYFANPLTGQNLNVGSAPNPTPRDRVEFAEVIPPAPPPAPPPPAPPPVVQAPPPPVAQAAPPPPRPAQRMFVVFFDFDKYNLTEQAESIVREAAAEARRQPGVRVMVTGHTDTVGSRAYNQALSERRAQAVKTAMVRAGLDPNEISTVGRNFSDPLVPTGPGIREPQNRRAVIDLGGAIS
jgi:outer membrane protein OmpA-like peptidoglycan-associated protein